MLEYLKWKGNWMFGKCIMKGMMGIFCDDFNLNKDWFWSAFYC